MAFATAVLTSDISLWLNVMVEVRLDETEPLLDAAFNVSATLADVSKHFLAT